MILKVFAARCTRGSRHETARKLLLDNYWKIFGRQMPEIFTSDTGKPYFADDSAFFSFSYTENLCICAIADNPVGVDAEAIRSVGENLQKGVLSRNERQFLTASCDRNETFMRYWTLKEAYCKFTGKGIAGTSLRETEFDIAGNSPVLLGQENLHFDCRVFDMAGVHVVISVCTDSPCCPEFLFEGDELC